ncbi:MAG TPA: DMT family transporter [Spirochaetia bacterium]|nr:DMT family transporter [Spirochaetia bacterium]
MNSISRGILLVLLSAAGFGLMPIFASYAYESGLNVPTLLFLRFAFAAVILFGYLFVKNKQWGLTRKQIALLLLLGGVLYTLQSFFYFSSVKYVPVPLAVLLLDLYPVFVAILSSFVNRERPSKSVVFSIVLSLLGIVLVVGRPSGSVSLAGVLYAIGAAVVYSLYIVIASRVALQTPPIVTSSFVVLFASLSFLVSGALTGTLQFRFATSGWLPAFGVAFFSTSLAIFSFLTGMNTTGPTRASIISMLEPVVSIMASAILLNEQMTFSQIGGGLLVLAGAVSVVLARNRAKSEEHC